VGGIGEPEERERVAAAHVEEEVLALAVRQVERLDQPHAEHLGGALDGPLLVRADQRQVVDAAEIELLVPPFHERSSSGLAVRSKSKLSFSSAPGARAWRGRDSSAQGAGIGSGR